MRKLNLYADAGVREYWIVDPLDRTVSVYPLKEGSIRATSYTFQDKIKASIFDDLYINFSDIAEQLNI